MFKPVAYTLRHRATGSAYGACLGVLRTDLSGAGSGLAAVKWAAFDRIEEARDA